MVPKVLKLYPIDLTLNIWSFRDQREMWDTLRTICVISSSVSNSSLLCWIWVNIKLSGLLCMAINTFYLNLIFVMIDHKHHNAKSQLTSSSARTHPIWCLVSQYLLHPSPNQGKKLQKSGKTNQPRNTTIRIGLIFFSFHIKLYFFFP